MTSSEWGRVDDDGTVYVKTADGERAVGQYPDGTPYGEKKGDTFAFDPGVLVDDDGKAYLYVGFSPEGPFKLVFQLRGNRVEEAFDDTEDRREAPRSIYNVKLAQSLRIVVL